MGVLVADALPSDPLAALVELARTEAELADLRRAQVTEARTAGTTWEQIGEALGMTRQAAWEFYMRDVRDAMDRNADANTDLNEDEAMQLAVGEVRAARQDRRKD